MFSADRTIVEVVGGEADMCLHQELGYVPWSPDVVWFFCRKAPSSGGQTTVCDGIKFAQSLSQSTIRILIDKPILYNHHWPAEKRLSYGRYHGRCHCEAYKIFLTSG